MISTTLHPISHRFEVIADHCLNLRSSWAHWKALS